MFYGTQYPQKIKSTKKIYPEQFRSEHFNIFQFNSRVSHSLIRTPQILYQLVSSVSIITVWTAPSVLDF